MLLVWLYFIPSIGIQRSNLGKVLDFGPSFCAFTLKPENAIEAQSFVGLLGGVSPYQSAMPGPGKAILASQKLNECTNGVCIAQLNFTQNAFIGPEFMHTNWCSYILPLCHVQRELSPIFVPLFGETSDILFLFFLCEQAPSDTHVHQKSLFFSVWQISGSYFSDSPSFHKNLLGICHGTMITFATQIFHFLGKGWGSNLRSMRGKV